MTPELAVLVPVLGRPHRVRPFLDSLKAATTVPHQVVFLCSLDDAAEQMAIDETEYRGRWVCSIREGYAAKVNDGVRMTRTPFVFIAADDLDFKAGWYEAAKARVTDQIQVVGVNDLIDRPHRPDHATHFLVTRAYAERPCIDESRGPMFEGYRHWFIDDELIATATRRGVYAYAEDSHVEHLHPMNGKAKDDDTYRLGRERRRDDRRLFRRRSRLWA